MVMPQRTERLLRALREAIGAATATATPTPTALVDNLISVVVRGLDLDATLFALACQKYRPLEIVGPASAFAHLGTFSTSPEPRGRYVAFLEDGDLVYPRHFVELVAALDRSGAAWACAPGREVSGDGYVTAKRFVPLSADGLGALGLDGAARAAGVLVDRSRTGAIPLEHARLIEKLGGLFAPALVTGGPTWERRGPWETALDGEAPVLLSLAELARIAHPDLPLRYRLADAMDGVLRRAAPLRDAVKALAGKLLP